MQRTEKESEEKYTEETTCTISDENHDTITVGTIKRYYKDLNCKIFARKASFKSAIASFSKEDRVALWECFLENVKVK